MSSVKKIKDKKVNFEFNKEYIKVVTSKIANNDALFITNSFNEMHPADAADIIEHLNQSDRESLIKLNNFNIDPEVFVELNESIQAEDGIRDRSPSRGLGDVYKRQFLISIFIYKLYYLNYLLIVQPKLLSLIHI